MTPMVKYYVKQLNIVVLESMVTTCWFPIPMRYQSAIFAYTRPPSRTVQQASHTTTTSVLDSFSLIVGCYLVKLQHAKIVYASHLIHYTLIPSYHIYNYFLSLNL